MRRIEQITRIAPSGVRLLTPGLRVFVFRHERSIRVIRQIRLIGSNLPSVWPASRNRLPDSVPAYRIEEVRFLEIERENDLGPERRQ
jgi:hypothetical protein